jgi:hypothetical protein
MRKYKPSHRPDYRYLLLQNEDRLDVEGYLLEFFGISGFGRLEFRAIEKKGKEELIRVERGMAQEVAGSLLISKKRIRIEKISGTILRIKKG